MMPPRWITNDPEIAAQLRLADDWHANQRRQANRLAFNADRLRRAAVALGKKAERDRAADYADILARLSGSGEAETAAR